MSGQIHLFDRLLAINGFPPGSPGARVPDHETRVEITISPADPAEAVEELAVETLSVTLEREPDEGFGLGMAFDGEAVILSAIGEGTPAMRCGQLRKGDLVVSINGEPVIASSNFGALIAQEATSISLDLMRIVSGGVYEPTEREGAADEQAADDAQGDVGAMMGARAHAPSPASSGVTTTGNLVQTVVQAVFGEDLDKSDAALEAAFAFADVSPKMGTLDAHEMRSRDAISVHEMRAYIKSVYKNGIDDKTIDDMFARADTNKDGELSLAEFKVIMRAGPKKSSGAIGGAVDAGVGATVDGVKATGNFLYSGLEKTLETLGVTAGFQAVFGEDIDRSDAGLEAAFASVDANQSGHIDSSEMRAFIQRLYEDDMPRRALDRTIAKMMAAADMNKDGEIDLNEFKVIVRAGPKVSAAGKAAMATSAVAAPAKDIKLPSLERSLEHQLSEAAKVDEAQRMSELIFDQTLVRSDMMHESLWEVGLIASDGL